MTDETTDARPSRRSLLKRGALASTAAMAGLAGCLGGGEGGDPTTTEGTIDASHPENRVLKHFVIRKVEGYANDFAGRILAISREANADSSEVPVGECRFADWSPDTTLTFHAQFLDHRVRPPRSIPLIVYTGQRGDPVNPEDHFIINDASQCPGNYVGVEAEWFQRDL